MTRRERLEMLPVEKYVKAGDSDPIAFYRMPVVGHYYRKRVELCLSALNGGDRVLEVGFGSGATFLNLSRLYKEIHGLDLNSDTGAVAKIFGELGIMTYLKNGNVLKMEYPDNYFDSVLLISILEHLKPEDQDVVFKEIRRVLKKNGQVVYGVPVSRPFMKFLFRIMGYDIDLLHFSTEKQIRSVAERAMNKSGIIEMKLPLIGSVYEVGNFTKI